MSDTNQHPELSPYDAKHIGAFREWAMAANSSPYAAWEIRRAEARSLFEQLTVTRRERDLALDLLEPDQRELVLEWASNA